MFINLYYDFIIFFHVKDAILIFICSKTQGQCCFSYDRKAGKCRVHKYRLYIDLAHYDAL